MAKKFAKNGILPWEFFAHTHAASSSTYVGTAPEIQLCWMSTIKLSIACKGQNEDQHHFRESPPKTYISWTVIQLDI